MIQEKTQEAPYTIEYINQKPTPEIKSHIAFIGSYTECSLLAGRAIKTHRIDYDSSIAREFDLPHYDSQFICYWVKENQMLFEDNTVTYVIVHDDNARILEIRRELLKQLKESTAEGEGEYEEPIIQISKLEGADGLSNEQKLLNQTDWAVVKQLELLLLSDTDLGKYRAALRKQIKESE